MFLCGGHIARRASSRQSRITPFDDDFSAKVRAREAQVDTLADEILDIADDSANDWIERFGRDGEIVGRES